MKEKDKLYRVIRILLVSFAIYLLLALLFGLISILKLYSIVI